jgi:RND superfamily putative drug exporter
LSRRRTPPISARTQQLVHAVRAQREPFYVGVTGQTAGFVDLEHSLASHLPLVLAVVVLSTLIVLFLMTGSVVLPVKAVLMNALPSRRAPNPSEGRKAAVR